MHIVGMYYDVGGAVVVHLHYFAFVQRHGLRAAFLPVIKSSGIPAVALQFIPALEQPGIVGHVEHAQVAHRPHFFRRRLFCFHAPIYQYRLAAVYQYRLGPVYRRGNFRIAFAAEDRRAAGVGIDGAKIFRA